ncbi:MAG: outer membrane lipoprotein-sorting protein [Myxococcota bacterium]
MPLPARLRRSPLRNPQALRALLAGLALAALLAPHAQANRPVPDEVPASGEARAEDAGQSGRDIYARVLENRFHSFRQTARLVSGDRAGNQQESAFRMWFTEDAPKEDRERAGAAGRGSNPSRMIASQTLVRYLEPFDLRHTGYLILNRHTGPSDQFLYLASERRIRRVSLRGEPVFGSDFSFEDVLPSDIDDFDYTRIDDEALDQVAVFVIEATPKSGTISEYSKLRIYIEKDRAIPLLTRYWSERGIETKTLDVDRAAIEKHADVWVAMRMTMRNLQQGSYTRLEVEDIEPNVIFEETTFEMRRLIAH